MDFAICPTSWLVFHLCFKIKRTSAVHSIRSNYFQMSYFYNYTAVSFRFLCIYNTFMISTNTYNLYIYYNSCKPSKYLINFVPLRRDKYVLFFLFSLFFLNDCFILHLFCFCCHGYIIYIWHLSYRGTVMTRLNYTATLACLCFVVAQFEHVQHSANVGTQRIDMGRVVHARRRQRSTERGLADFRDGLN